MSGKISYAPIGPMGGAFFSSKRPVVSSEAGLAGLATMRHASWGFASEEKSHRR